MNEVKIFGIGFHKTGTKSLKSALELLGYSVAGPNSVKNIDSEKKLYEIVNINLPLYDAFQDNPWPLVYKYVDKLYSEAKFILTIRDEDEWIQSVVKYFGDKSTAMRRYVYGYPSPLGHEKIYIKRYKKHNDEVISYFKNRKDKLLVCDFAKGDGWEKICQFLNINIPEDTPFPHKNKNRKKN